MSNCLTIIQKESPLRRGCRTKRLNRPECIAVTKPGWVLKRCDSCCISLFYICHYNVRSPLCSVAQMCSEDYYIHGEKYSIE